MSAYANHGTDGGTSAHGPWQAYPYSSKYGPRAAVATACHGAVLNGMLCDLIDPKSRQPQHAEILAYGLSLAQAQQTAARLNGQPSGGRGVPLTV